MFSLKISILSAKKSADNSTKSSTKKYILWKSFSAWNTVEILWKGTVSAEQTVGKCRKSKNTKEHLTYVSLYDST